MERIHIACVSYIIEEGQWKIATTTASYKRGDSPITRDENESILALMKEPHTEPCLSFNSDLA